MELVDVVTGGFGFRAVSSDQGNSIFCFPCCDCLVLETVFGDTVPDLILDDQHTDFLQLLTQLPNIKAHDPVIDIHIGPVIKHGKRTGNIDFQSGGNVLGFLFRLLAEGIVKIPKDGHILRFRVIEIILVD